VDIGVGMQKVAENPECPKCIDPRLQLSAATRKVVFGGDTHGDVEQVRFLIRKAKEVGAQAVFVLGDFGIWSHLDGGAFVSLVSAASFRADIPVFFLPGNHDNYDLLEEYERDNARTSDGFVLVAPGVLYSPRGHRWNWGGVRFLSLGGAYSIDKPSRLEHDAAAVRKAEARREQERSLSPVDRYALRSPHISWWPQEEINDEERDRAIGDGSEVDVLLTHDKPLASRPNWNRKNIPECIPNQEQIQKVVDAVRPTLLLHGHLHYAYHDEIESTGTFVHALDCDPSASRSSGGSGKRHLSYAVLDMDRTRPSIPEPGADEDCYNLAWRTVNGGEMMRDLLRKEA
jgi:Icc-related predicted phosphoesterase